MELKQRQFSFAAISDWAHRERHLDGEGFFTNRVPRPARFERCLYPTSGSAPTLKTHIALGLLALTGKRCAAKTAYNVERRRAAVYDGVRNQG